MKDIVNNDDQIQSNADKIEKRFEGDHQACLSLSARDIVYA